MSKSRRDYEIEILAPVIAGIREAGFRVFIAEKGNYGFYTDKEGSKVISFQSDLGGVSFSGNYKSKYDGTGWRIGENFTEFKNIFKAPVPYWASRNYKITTLEQHLDQYQSSSKYIELI